MILWFVAAGLAFIGVGISFVADHGIHWTLLAGGFFCVVMALSALARGRPSPPKG